MTTEKTPAVHLAADDAELYLGIDGNATHTVSMTAEQIAGEYLASAPAHSTVTLDLADCAWVDSTFAGWMIRLSQQMNRLQGQLVISHCPPACRSSLDVMGIAGLFTFHDTRPPGPTHAIPCGLEEADASTVEFMLRAHQDLASVSDDNRETYTPIVATLRDELKKRSSS